jgi:hypothetical protein
VPNWKVRSHLPKLNLKSILATPLSFAKLWTFSSSATPLLTNWVPNGKVHICPIQFSQVNFVIGPAFPSCQLHIAILQKIHETLRWIKFIQKTQSYNLISAIYSNLFI